MGQDGIKRSRADPARKALDTALQLLSDSCIRNGLEAVSLAEQLCSASGYCHPEELDVLAAAQAETQQFDNAIATGRRAVELWRPTNNRDAAALAERRLQCYERREPWRESL